MALTVVALRPRDWEERLFKAGCVASYVYGFIWSFKLKKSAGSRTKSE